MSIMFAWYSLFQNKHCSQWEYHVCLIETIQNKHCIQWEYHVCVIQCILYKHCSQWEYHVCVIECIKKYHVSKSLSLYNWILTIQFIYLIPLATSYGVVFQHSPSTCFPSGKVIFIGVFGWAATNSSYSFFNLSHNCILVAKNSGGGTI